MAGCHNKFEPLAVSRIVDGFEFAKVYHASDLFIAFVLSTAKI